MYHNSEAAWVEERKTIRMALFLQGVAMLAQKCASPPSVEWGESVEGQIARGSICLTPLLFQVGLGSLFLPAQAHTGPAVWREC